MNIKQTSLCAQLRINDAREDEAVGITDWGRTTNLSISFAVGTWQCAVSQGRLLEPGPECTQGPGSLTPAIWSMRGA